MTGVELDVGASQRPHKHPLEQCHVIKQGRGKMYVGEENQMVQEGDNIHIPSNVLHHIENKDEKVLIFVSASTKAFNFETPYNNDNLSK